MENKKSWNMGNIFWGLLLVLIGSLFLLNNLEIVDVNFSNVWRLWPLLIVAAGLSLLPVRGWIGNAVGVIAVLAMLGLVMLVALNIIGPDSTSRSEVQSSEPQRSSEPTTLNVNAKAGAGEISINSASDVATVAARLDSSFATLNQESIDKNGTQEVTISTNGSKDWWDNGNFKNDLSLTLTQSLPLDFRLDVGASHVVADLSEVQLRELTIDSGASDLKFKLGSKMDMTDVNLDIGASSITLQVPEDSGVSLEVKGGLSNKQLPGFEKKSDDYYETKNYNDAKKKIVIRGDMGIANLSIEKY